MRALLVVCLAALCGCDAGEPPGPPPDPFKLMPPAEKGGRSALEPFLVPKPRLQSSEGAPVSVASASATPDPDQAPPPPHREEDDDAGACPPEMVVIHGNHCTVSRQDCLEWLDQESPGAPKKRCARFKKPSECIGEIRHMRYCIDRLEAAETPGSLPITDISWTVAREQCESKGKRLCTETEWTFACEGEQMRPYPYGFERDATLCNFDRMDLLENHKMADHRHPANAHPNCLSPFGVQNMVGNADEWVWLEKGYKPMRSGLKGGWWLAGRNRCRPTTGGHDEYFHEIQAGYRCCKDAAPEKAKGAAR